jgi:Arc/MetJ-type ribon-helix-helix transcriptional regulator
MPNITLSLPEDLHRKIKEHPEIRWSEVVRRVLSSRVRDLERMDQIARHSRLALRDVDELDHLVKEGLLQRYRKPAKPEGG